MTWDLAFDPVTGDLKRDAAGGWETTITGDTSVLNQLCVHYNRWWADPNIGSLLFDHDRFTANPGPEIAAETDRALSLLVTEAVIANLQVTAAESRSKAGRVEVRTLYRVVATGQNIETLLPALGRVLGEAFVAATITPGTFAGTGASAGTSAADAPGETPIFV